MLRHHGGEELFEPKRAVLALASKLGLYGALQKFDKDSHGFYAALRSTNGRGALVLLKGKLGAGTEEYPGLGYRVEELKNDDSLPPAARTLLNEHLAHPICILVSPPECVDDELSSGAPGRKWGSASDPERDSSSVRLRARTAEHNLPRDAKAAAQAVEIERERNQRLLDAAAEKLRESEARAAAAALAAAGERLRESERHAAALAAAERLRESERLQERDERLRELGERLRESERLRAEAKRRRCAIM